MNRRAPFRFASAEKPCFEDSRLGTALFWLALILAAGAVLYRFHAVMFGGAL